MDAMQLFAESLFVESWLNQCIVGCRKKVRFQKMYWRKDAKMLKEKAVGKHSRYVSESNLMSFWWALTQMTSL